MHCKVLDEFHRIFHGMEQMEIVYVNNPIHISVPHFGFGPRIQSDLDQLLLAYSNYAVRTEKHKTQNQLWQKGVNVESYSKYLPVKSDVDVFSCDFLKENNLNHPIEIRIILPRYTLPPLHKLKR